MTDLTAAYRIETPIPEGKTYTAGEAWMVDWEEGFAIVPDGRLQAIADAARCEHGNIYRHQIAWADGGIGWYSNDEWCEGAPELAALLDALGGTDNG